MMSINGIIRAAALILSVLCSTCSEDMNRLPTHYSETFCATFRMVCTSSQFQSRFSSCWRTWLSLRFPSRASSFSWGTTKTRTRVHVVNTNSVTLIHILHTTSKSVLMNRVDPPGRSTPYRKVLDSVPYVYCLPVGILEHIAS